TRSVHSSIPCRTRSAIQSSRWGIVFLRRPRTAKSLRVALRDQLSLREPRQRLLLPGVPHRAFVAVQAMPARRELEVPRRDLSFLERIVKSLTVGREHDSIVESMRQKRRRGARRHLLFVREGLHELGRGLLSQQVGPATG